MGTTILRPADLLWDLYVAGPFINNASQFNNVGTARDQLWWPAYTPLASGQATPRPVWIYSQGGGGVTSVQDYYRGVICSQTNTTIVASVESMGGLSFQPQIDITDLNPSVRLPSAQRVAWLSAMIAMDVGTLDRNTGLLLMRLGTNQVADIWPLAPAATCNGAFGIVGDGAGNWNFESFDDAAPPSTVLESVSLAPAIADPADWHIFDFVVISGAGGREAAFELHIDGEVFLTRNWVTGTTLFPLEPGAHRYSPIWRVATTSGDNIYMGPWEFRMGRFLPDGRELLK